MKAVILVGGYGTRMRPLTYLVPKCMLPVGGQPLLQRTIRYLKGYGITEFVLCVAYLRKQIIDHFAEGSDLGVHIQYAQTDLPLGTAGQLKIAERYVSDQFLAMNGDIVTSLNIENLVKAHNSNSRFATIALKKFEVKIPYGYVNTDSDSRITGFQEKPTLQYLANAGVYVFEPKLFDYIPANEMFSLETDVFPKLIQEGKRLDGYFEDAYWADVGSFGDFERVDNEIMTENQARLQSLKTRSAVVSDR